MRSTGVRQIRRERVWTHRAQRRAPAGWKPGMVSINPLGTPVIRGKTTSQERNGAQMVHTPKKVVSRPRTKPGRSRAFSLSVEQRADVLVDPLVHLVALLRQRLGLLVLLLIRQDSGWRRSPVTSNGLQGPELRILSPRPVSIRATSQWFFLDPFERRLT